MTLGERICTRRMEHGLSQADLAEALGVSRQSVSKWETDASTPELDKLIRLSEIFSVTLDELIRGESASAGKNDEADGDAHGAASCAQAPPQAAPTSSVSATQKVIGIILLCFGLLTVLLLFLLGGGLAALFFGLPFLLCGVICLGAKKRAGLWCAWCIFICVCLYLRYATGIRWSIVLLTLRYEASWNYMRLIIGWAQVICALMLVLSTLISFRKQRLAPTRRRLVLLGTGWAGGVLFYFAKGWALGALARQIYAQDFSRGMDILYTLLSGIGDFITLACLSALLVFSAAVLRGRAAAKKHTT